MSFILRSTEICIGKMTNLYNSVNETEGIITFGTPMHRWEDNM